MAKSGNYHIMRPSDLDTLEKLLSSQMYVSGHRPGAEDASVFNQFVSAKLEPKQEVHPSFFGWYALISLYSHGVVNSWSGGKVEEKKPKEEKKEEKGKKEGGNQNQNQSPQKGKKEPKAEQPKAEKPKPAVKQETPTPAKDECDDLFGDDNEDDKKKLEELAAKKKKEKEDKDKDKGKPALIAKSIVLLDVKVFEIEQDLDVLAKKVIREIVKEGLVWKTEYQLLDVAFGIKKIRIGCVVEDEKVSVDDLIDDIQAWEEEVQSVDIVSFNKL